MSRKGEETRYWYFRFNEFFFDDFEIIKMQGEPGGYEYLVILLKLYCLSVRNGGVFSMKSTEDGQLDLLTLADAIRHKVSIVSPAIRYFTEKGFVQILVSPDETEVHLPGVKNMVGSSSRDADQKRLERSMKKEKELLPEPEENSRIKNCEVFGTFGNVLLLPEESKKLFAKYENAAKMIERLSVYKAQYNKEYDNDYAALLGFAEKDGKLKQSEFEKREVAYQRYKREAELGFPPPSEMKEVLTAMQFKELEDLAEKRAAEQRN